MVKYLLDTNICIHLFRNKYGILSAIDRVGFENCAISELTKAELLQGELMAASKGHAVNGAPLRQFFKKIQIIPISDAIELFVSEKVRLMDLGTPVDDFDILIGCTAIVNKLTMVSENISNLGRLSGIKLENWVKR